MRGAFAPELLARRGLVGLVRLVEFSTTDVAACAVHLLRHIARITALIDHLLGGDHALGIQAP